MPRDLLRERVRSAVTGIPAAGGLLGKMLPALAWRILLPAPLAALYRRMGLFERAGLVGMSDSGPFHRLIAKAAPAAHSLPRPTTTTFMAYASRFCRKCTAIGGNAA